jgi:probable HAF family extracellular repeat protein
MMALRLRSVSPVAAGVLALALGAAAAFAQRTAASGAGEPPRYCGYDLGTSSGDAASYPAGINDRGAVIANTLDGRAFLIDDGRVRPVAPLPGDDRVAVFAINGSGVIVGNSVNSRSDIADHPFVHHDGRTTPITGLTDAIPYAIDDQNRIVGAARELGAFVYRQGAVSFLGRPGSAAYGMNSGGEVVGVNDAGQAFVFRDGRMQSLGTLPGHAHSEARDISDDGRIVGFSGSVGMGEGEAFAATATGGMRGLGKLAATDVFSIALSIDARGRAVVGSSGSSADLFGLTGLRAFVYREEAMFDLNAVTALPPGVILTAANAINDRGEIAAQGVRNDQLHAFLLTPRHGAEPCELSSPRQ